jgi:hypothetical protein
MYRQLPTLAIPALANRALQLIVECLVGEIQLEFPPSLRSLTRPPDGYWLFATGLTLTLRQDL